MRPAVIGLSLLALFSTTAFASKLSHYLHKQEAKEQAQQEQEIRGDMNFADFNFRLSKRYVNERGERCRDYDARSRSNPYRHSYYTVCDER